MTTRALQWAKPRRLLARLLDAPNLPQLVRNLDPRLLHQLVRHCGLEECGEIVALATTEQLTRVFDDDLWGSDAGGAAETFDAERFGVWLEVLVEVGADVAAQKLAAMDLDFVSAALSRHLLVLDPEILMGTRTAVARGWVDDELDMDALDALGETALERSVSHELGGYTLVARRAEAWDALLAVAVSLDHDHPAFFARLMKRCSQISTEYVLDNGGLYEVLTADEQVMEDVAGAREERRDEQGHVAPTDAAAFLERARRGRGRAAERDPLAVRYFEGLAARGGSRPARPPVPPPPSDGLERDVTAFLASVTGPPLADAGRPLLDSGPTTTDRLSRIRSRLAFVEEHDGALYERRSEELAYLANVLVAGCSFQSRRFRAAEAADAVLATCNLALEERERSGHRACGPGCLVDDDLLSLFADGWGLLYDDVVLFATEHLIAVLAEIRGGDSLVQRDLQDLRRRLSAQHAAGTPWRERDHLDVLAALDPPSWSVLLNLIDECPVAPKNADAAGGAERLLRIDPAFEFIAERRQIIWIHAFVAALPRSLGS